MTHSGNTPGQVPGDLVKQIVDRAPDAIIYADREGIIRLWNEGAERIFGHHADHAIGQSLDLIIPERHRERHWQGYEKTMSTGHTKYGHEMLAVPALHAGAGQIASEFSVILILGEGGRPAGVAAILRDVTARRKKEKEMRERIKALESGEGT